MCVQFIPIALAAAGQAIQFLSQQSAQKDQEQAAIRAAQRQSEAQQRARDVVNRIVADQTPERRQPQLEQIQKDETQRIQGTIDRVREAGPGNLNTRVEGNVSPDFLAAKARETKTQLENSATLARILGKVRAPQLLRAEDAFSQARAGTELGTNANFARGNANTDALRIQEAGRVDPIAQLFGSALAAAGVAGVGGSAGTGGTPPPGPPAPGPSSIVNPGPVTLFPVPPRGTLTVKPLR